MIVRLIGPGKLNWGLVELGENAFQYDFESVSKLFPHFTGSFVVYPYK